MLRVNYWYALGFLVVSALILFGLSRSSLGLILQATGQDRIEAAALGFNVTKHKLAAFCISALFSGLAGGMLTFYEGTASVDTVVSLAITVQIVIAVVFGGRRTILGAHPGLDLPDPVRRVAAPARPAQHLRGVGDRAGGDHLLPGRRAGLGAAPAGAALMHDIAWTPMRNSAPLLEVSGLTKRFGGLVAVRDIGFSIRPGEILGLIGPNGSGKSTVMKLVMGIERPNAGSVKLAGTEIAGWPTHRIARSGVGIVFQHSRPLHRQTVLENIKLALLPDSLLRLVAEPHVERRAREIAERVGLGAVMDRRPPTLPFADLRRLEMAKALARNPKVVLIDEPFAGLTQGEVATFSELIDGVPPRWPRGAAGGPQREERRRAGRSRAGDVSG